MKKCKCGKPVANNARTCPNCGHRFTSAPVLFLAWGFGIILLGAMLGAIFGNSSTNTQHQVTPSAASSAATSVPEVKAGIAKTDEAAMVIRACGKPSREYVEIVKGQNTKVRHLIYRQFKTELFYYTDEKGSTPWTLGNAFEDGQDETITMTEANRRMPCAKGKLKNTVLGID